MTIVPDGVLSNGNNAFVSLRRELVDRQKLIAVVSMPQGIFSAPTKKGSSSKGAGVKTSFLIFEKTNNGGTKKVWFYDMKNDGFSLDVKRMPIEGTEIPDIIKRFNNLEKEESNDRKSQSFMVDVDEIRSKNYELIINKYKYYEKQRKNYRSTKEILNSIKEQDDEIKACFKEITKFFED